MVHCCHRTSALNTTEGIRLLWMDSKVWDITKSIRHALLAQNNSQRPSSFEFCSIIHFLNKTEHFRSWGNQSKSSDSDIRTRFHLETLCRRGIQWLRRRNISSFSISQGVGDQIVTTIKIPSIQQWIQIQGLTGRITIWTGTASQSWMSTGFLY